MNIRKIAVTQGWTDDTLLSLLLDYIQGKGLSEDCAGYLAEIAAEENSDVFGNVGNEKA